ncbi:MAG: hypothetical protein O2931_12570 [Planctomycetota bacterium]|nr:hypothetical protein [Planctomycetota bacterium]MDA1179619.1 hypothetical protein [Planctomycetota bacterium]
MIKKAALSTVCIFIIFHGVLLTSDGQGANLVTAVARGSGTPDPVTDLQEDEGLFGAEAVVDFNTATGGANTGFSRATARGAVTLSDPTTLQSITGTVRADTSSVPGPTAPNPFHTSSADLTINVDLLVEGGSETGFLQFTVDNLQVLAGAFLQFNGEGVGSAAAGSSMVVVPPYTRGVPFTFRIFGHSEAFSNSSTQADDVIEFALSNFRTASTSGGAPNPGAIVRVLPEPSGLSILWCAMGGVLLRRRLVPHI